MPDVVQGSLVYSRNALTHRGAGTFSYAGHGNIEHAGLVFNCPCGCGTINVLPFLRTQPGQPVWGWDGNVLRPTVTPPIWLRSGCGWHGQLTAGVWHKIQRARLN